MRTTDKVLIAIVIGIVVLVIGAFTVVLLRPETTYQDEGTPDGVVFNYLLALQREDYARARAYLSLALVGRPLTVESFERQVRKSYPFKGIGESSFAIESTELLGLQGARALVKVREIYFRGGGLFESGQRLSFFEMDLLKVGVEWQIRGADRYFLFCWDREDGCG